MTGSYDLLEALATAWDGANLDAQFTSAWNDPGLAGNFPVLSDGEAAEGTPFPYCVFEQTTRPDREETMSCEPGYVAVIWRHAFEFHVHSQDKTVAKNMIKAIKAVFDNAELTAGDSTITKITNAGDYCERSGEENWTWFLFYTALQSTSEST